MTPNNCPPAKFVTNFTMVPQGIFNHLCWAAVALSVDQLLNPDSNWKQLCDVVGDTDPNPAGCCSHPLSSDCNHEGLLIKGLEAHQLNSFFGAELGPYDQGPNGPLNAARKERDWRVIKCEIDAGRVVCAGVDWGIKHYTAIYGYQECNGQRSVWVLDPLFDPSASLSYDQFVSNYLDAGKWTEMDRIKGALPCP